MENGRRDESDFLLRNHFITGVSGRIGNRVYFTRNGKIRSRRHVIPSNPRTWRQQEGRSRFAIAVRQWRELDEDARALWRRRAKRRSRTGYNLFISEYLARREDVPIPDAVRERPLRPRRRKVRMVKMRAVRHEAIRRCARAQCPLMAVTICSRQEDP